MHAYICISMCVCLCVGKKKPSRLPSQKVPTKRPITSQTPPTPLNPKQMFGVEIEPYTLLEKMEKITTWTNPNSHTRTHARTHTHTHSHSHAHAHTHAHTETHTHARAHTHTHTRAHTHTHTRARAHTHTFSINRTSRNIYFNFYTRWVPL